MRRAGGGRRGGVRTNKRPSAGWYRDFFDRTYLEILRGTHRPGSSRRQARFVLKALGLRRAGRILDVACGYGRHAAEMAARGNEVLGVDLSPAMIAEARRLWKGKPRLAFRKADMRRLAFDAEFDAVTNLFTSFGYFPHRQNVAVLGRMARALRPGGRIVIDHRDREHDRRLLAGRSGLRVWWEVGKAGYILEEARFDAARGVTESTWRLLRPGSRRLWRRSFRLHLYSYTEWRELFQGAGLRLTDMFSAYDGRPYRKGAGPRLILVGERSKA